MADSWTRITVEKTDAIFVFMELCHFNHALACSLIIRPCEIMVESSHLKEFVAFSKDLGIFYGYLRRLPSSKTSGELCSLAHSQTIKGHVLVPLTVE